MTSTNTNVFEQVALFQDLGPAEWDRLTARAQLRSYPKNAILVTEGDETDSLFIIKSGRVKIYLSDEEGREMILNIQGPGDYFGEVALLDGAPRSSSAMALENCELYVIKKREFEQFLLHHPEVALQVIKGLTQRLRTLTDNVRNIALKDVYGRIVAVLNKMAEEDKGLRVIRQRLTHKDIAAMVGSSREMVSRIFKELSNGGYLASDKHGIIIKKKLPARW
ncbi:MAG TPA: Crp/Fnr family transcriptional regulator [Gammaproteobacteria bacterium]|nr:Crp/Fnr family transcriptional regulator [Gammaproteobacteria bacterium]